MKALGGRVTFRNNYKTSSLKPYSNAIFDVGGFNNMENTKNFLALLQQQPLLKSILKYQDFSKIDFTDLDFTKEIDSIYTFRDIHIGEHLFKSVYVSISSRMITIKMLSNETIFFDDPLTYFGQEGFFVETEPILVDTVQHSDFRRKLRAFELFDREARVSIFKSTAYGCVIELVFMDQSKINSLFNSLES